MHWSDGEDAPLEWRASDDESHAGRQFTIGLVIFSIPAVILLFAGAASTALGVGLVLLLIGMGVLIGILDWWVGQRQVVSIIDDGDLFVARQVNGQVRRFPFAAVTRVRATRDSQGDDTLRMGISVDGTAIRTRFGRAEPAAPFLARWAAAGADVSYRTETSD